MTAKTPSVIVGYDDSPGAEAAVTWATSWAKAHDASLTLVRVLEWPSLQGVPIVFGHIDPQQEAKRRVNAAAARTGLPKSRVRTMVVTGSPASVLVDESDGADLLVVGRRGVGDFEELLVGSVGKECALHAHCPVAVIRV